MSPNEKASIHILAVCLVQAVVFAVLIQSEVHYEALFGSCAVWVLILPVPFIYFRFKPVSNDEQMKEETKRSNLLLFGLLALKIILVVLALAVFHSPTLFFAIVILFVFLMSRFRKGRESNKMVFFGIDERDKLIALKSTRLAYLVFGLAWVYYAVLTLQGKNPSDQIPAYFLYNSLFGGVWLLFFVQSLSSIIFYHRGVSYEES